MLPIRAPRTIAARGTPGNHALREVRAVLVEVREHRAQFTRLVEARDRATRSAGATTSLELCRQALATGSYLTVLPRGLVAGDVAARRLQVLPVAEFAWERPLALYVRRATPRIPALRAIITALRAAAHNWGTRE